MAVANNDITALRHWFGNDSPESDPLDLEVQHIFHRKDDDKAQFKTETSTTPNEPTNNQRLKPHRHPFEHSDMARNLHKASSPKIRHKPSNIQIIRSSHRSMIGNQVNERCLRYLEELCERVRVSFP